MPIPEVAGHFNRTFWKINDAIDNLDLGIETQEEHHLRETMRDLVEAKGAILRLQDALKRAGHV